MLDLFDGLLVNLEGKLLGTHLCWRDVSKEQAYEMLKQMTGEDWGYDVAAWKRRRLAIMNRQVSQPLTPEIARRRAGDIRRQLKARQQAAEPEAHEGRTGDPPQGG